MGLTSAQMPTVPSMWSGALPTEIHNRGISVRTSRPSRVGLQKENIGYPY